MTFSGLQAEPDLVGGRVRIRWSYTLGPGETLASVPRLQLARKELDYEFPDSAGQPSDPFLVYDSASFPPPGLTLSTLSTTDQPSGSGRQMQDVESGSGESGEVIRRITRITTDNSGSPLALYVEILDAATTVMPLTTYYYELRPTPRDIREDVRQYRASATTTRSYSLGRTMYGLLPEIYRRHDVVRRPPQLLSAKVPEAQDSGGQLQRFFEVVGSAADYLRSRTEGLLDIHDLHTADSKFLPLMASWIGWNLDFRASIPVQRHEVGYAAMLYRLTGTIPGCMIWVRRLTGWDARVKEFARNVFFSNDTGDPDDQKSTHSLTVDTSSAGTISNLKTFEDKLHYTYDPGTSNDSWYAYNTVGLYLKPAAGATVADTKTQASRLLSNLSLFLPVNVRGVVILDIPIASTQTDAAYALLNAQEQ